LNFGGVKIFLFAKKSRPSVTPTQPAIQWAPEFFPGYNVWGIRLMTHFHLVVRLRLSGSTPLLPP